VLFDSSFGNDADIAAWLDLNRPWKGTGDPLLLEMRQFLEVDDYAPNFAGDDIAGEAYLLVISDGGDSCGEDGAYDASHEWTDALALATESLLARGIPIGYSESADADTLDRIAEVGGDGIRQAYPGIGSGRALRSAARYRGQCVQLRL
jgi:hypothetical protein